MSDSSIHAQAIKSILAMKQTLLDEKAKNAATIKSLQERDRAIDRQLLDCDAALRIFQHEDTELFENLLPPPSPPTVREFITDKLRREYPHPVKAKDLRDEYERLARTELHWKTIGMSLYRLAQKQIARRDGHNWFFVPEDQRHADSETKNPGGATPGSSIFD